MVRSSFVFKNDFCLDNACNVFNQKINIIIKCLVKYLHFATVFGIRQSPEGRFLGITEELRKLGKHGLTDHLGELGQLSVRALYQQGSVVGDFQQEVHKDKL